MAYLQNKAAFLWEIPQTLDFEKKWPQPRSLSLEYQTGDRRQLIINNTCRRWTWQSVVDGRLKTVALLVDHTQRSASATARWASELGMT